MGTDARYDIPVHPEHRELATGIEVKVPLIAPTPGSQLFVDVGDRPAWSTDVRRGHLRAVGNDLAGVKLHTEYYQMARVLLTLLTNQLDRSGNINIIVIHENQVGAPGNSHRLIAKAMTPAFIRRVMKDRTDRAADGREGHGRMDSGTNFQAIAVDHQQHLIVDVKIAERLKGGSKSGAVYGGDDDAKSDQWESSD